MVFFTFLYLLIAAFVIWVWQPPAIPRLILLLLLILIYLWTSKRSRPTKNSKN
ncbi:hypothetical protein [Candidatus Enterococcus murrayae]|uniref:Uncharacterized protein n=1 Tax=Candidatus Enterococcus murrayae TaxID=2815321 RepID=A0ABS3HGC4_9ENTE|nr:hypothetical protein [Enterococcus sp. MJM16]MBO0452500.1 hypothetical protein [Enterococcus sp. MJM16]